MPELFSSVSILHKEYSSISLYIVPHQKTTQQAHNERLYLNFHMTNVYSHCSAAGNVICSPFSTSSNAETMVNTNTLIMNFLNPVYLHNIKWCICSAAEAQSLTFLCPPHYMSSFTHSECLSSYFFCFHSKHGWDLTLPIFITMTWDTFKVRFAP